MIGFLAKIFGAVLGAAAASGGNGVVGIIGMLFSALMVLWAISDLFYLAKDIINWIF